MIGPFFISLEWLSVHINNTKLQSVLTFIQRQESYLIRTKKKNFNGTQAVSLLLFCCRMHYIHCDSTQNGRVFGASWDFCDRFCVADKKKSSDRIQHSCSQLTSDPALGPFKKCPLETTLYLVPYIFLWCPLKKISFWTNISNERHWDVIYNS